MNDSVLPSTKEPWEKWLRQVFGRYFCDRKGNSISFASHHGEFWRWVWSIRRGERRHPFVAVWPRDGGKSTNAELACVTVGARKARRYALYISGTQEQADDHVQNVESLLETPALSDVAPALTERNLNKYGHSRGWRRNRLRTASGFTVDALGLNTGARGIKLEQHRPNLIILDDIDDEMDSPRLVDKKIRMITRKVLPAGSADVCVLAVQNLVHSDSVFSQLIDGRAGFLANRIVSGPYPAIEGLTYETVDSRTVLSGGTPTWEGLSLERCQEIVDDIGIDAFEEEHQHNVKREREGALWEVLPILWTGKRQN